MLIINLIIIISYSSSEISSFIGPIGYIGKERWNDFGLDTGKIGISGFKGL